jgi:hypothetical protein
MQEKIFSLGEGDQKVTLAFNLNVMAEIQKEYGSVQAWTELLEDDTDEPKRNGEPDMQAFITGFTLMVNEGVEIENEKTGDKKEPYTNRQIGRMVTTWGQAEVSKAMASAIASATDTGEPSKNGSSTTKTTTQA